MLTNAVITSNWHLRQSPRAARRRVALRASASRSCSAKMVSSSVPRQSPDFDFLPKLYSTYSNVSRGERGTGNREGGTGKNVEMWKCGNSQQPIPNPESRCGTRIPNPGSLWFPQRARPVSLQNLRPTQVALRHARVTLASMWLRRAMPYATIDTRVGGDGPCGKSDCGVAATAAGRGVRRKRMAAGRGRRRQTGTRREPSLRTPRPQKPFHSSPA